eukprot:TRINITY_DN9836_c0_g1_i1.p1 TRINITY_DN9836_c0_g1~~TRINITY_DN9836_c0_g1_i1.p1  ORF type:complete len:1037 (-),score=229.68 TRINITY_DN9836_c0_g1_i1:48-2858(-)
MAPLRLIREVAPGPEDTGVFFHPDLPALEKDVGMQLLVKFLRVNDPDEKMSLIKRSEQEGHIAHNCIVRFLESDAATVLQRQNYLTWLQDAYLAQLTAANVMSLALRNHITRNTILGRVYRKRETTMGGDRRDQTNSLHVKTFRGTDVKIIHLLPHFYGLMYLVPHRPDELLQTKTIAPGTVFKQFPETSNDLRALGGQPIEFFRGDGNNRASFLRLRPSADDALDQFTFVIKGSGLDLSAAHDFNFDLIRMYFLNEDHVENRDPHGRREGQEKNTNANPILPFAYTTKPGRGYLVYGAEDLGCSGVDFRNFNMRYHQSFKFAETNRVYRQVAGAFPQPYAVLGMAMIPEYLRRISWTFLTPLAPRDKRIDIPTQLVTYGRGETSLRYRHYLNDYTTANAYSWLKVLTSADPSITTKPKKDGTVLEKIKNGVSQDVQSAGGGQKGEQLYRIFKKETPVGGCGNLEICEKPALKVVPCPRGVCDTKVAPIEVWPDEEVLYFGPSFVERYKEDLVTKCAAGDKEKAVCQNEVAAEGSLASDLMMATYAGDLTLQEWYNTMKTVWGAEMPLALRTEDKAAFIIYNQVRSILGSLGLFLYADDCTAANSGPSFADRNFGAGARDADTWGYGLLGGWFNIQTDKFSDTFHVCTYSLRDLIDVSHTLQSVLVNVNLPFVEAGKKDGTSKEKIIYLLRVVRNSLHDAIRELYGLDLRFDIATLREQFTKWGRTAQGPRAQTLGDLHGKLDKDSKAERDFLFSWWFDEGTNDNANDFQTKCLFHDTRFGQSVDVREGYLFAGRDAFTQLKNLEAKKDVSPFWTEVGKCIKSDNVKKLKEYEEDATVGKSGNGEKRMAAQAELGKLLRAGLHCYVRKKMKDEGAPDEWTELLNFEFDDPEPELPQPPLIPAPKDKLEAVLEQDIIELRRKEEQDVQNIDKIVEGD